MIQTGPPQGSVAVGKRHTPRRETGQYKSLQEPKRHLVVFVPFQHQASG